MATQDVVLTVEVKPVYVLTTVVPTPVSILSVSAVVPRLVLDTTNEAV